MTSLERIVFGHNVIWIIVDRLTKFVHFLPFNIKFSLKKLPHMHIREIIRLYDKFQIKILVSPSRF